MVIKMYNAAGLSGLPAAVELEDEGLTVEKYLTLLEQRYRPGLLSLLLEVADNPASGYLVILNGRILSGKKDFRLVPPPNSELLLTAAVIGG